MRKWNLLVIVSMLVIVTSCGENGTQRSDVVKNRIEPDLSASDLIVVDVENKEGADLMDFVDSVRFICLETTADCPIGDIDEFLCTDSVIVVADRWNAKAVYLFDWNGKFINSVSRKGNGPTEYITECPHISISPDGKMIMLQDNYRDQCLWYDRCGNFVRSTDTPQQMGDCEMLGDNRFLYNADYRQGSDASVFVMTDSTNACLQSIKNVGYRNASFMNAATLTREGSKTIGVHRNTNTVYQFTESSTQAVCRIEIRPDDIINHKFKNQNQYLEAVTKLPSLTSRVLVMDNAICFNVSVGKHTKRYLFSRTNERLYCINDDESSFYTYAFGEQLTCIDDNWIVCPIATEMVSELDYFRKTAADRRLMALKQTVQPDDNPVLVLLHLKDGF